MSLKEMESKSTAKGSKLKVLDRGDEWFTFNIKRVETFTPESIHLNRSIFHRAYPFEQVMNIVSFGAS